MHACRLDTTETQSDRLHTGGCHRLNGCWTCEPHAIEAEGVSGVPARGRAPSQAAGCAAAAVLSTPWGVLIAFSPPGEGGELEGWGLEAA